MVLGLIGVGLSALAINSAVKQRGKKAYPRLDNKQFDADNASNGIAHGGFSEEKIMKIAARCGVRPNKHGILPQNGKNNCLRYVSRYADHDNDVINFKKAWDRTIKKQLKNRSSDLREKYSNNYEYKKNIVDCRGHGYFGGPNIVLEIFHWDGISKEEQLRRMKDLQNNSIWGDVCVKKPKLRRNSNNHYPSGYVEVWTLSGGKDDVQGKRSTMKKYKNLYRDCCAHLGYDAML